MSPIAINFYRSVKTSLQINGPIISFSDQPDPISVSSGTTATFIGFSTIFYENPAGIPGDIGPITYRWYEKGVGPLSDGDGITGTATTILTLSNMISPDDNGRIFFLESTYSPTETTGGAPNSPQNSIDAKLTVNPFINILNQPTGKTTYTNTNAAFNVNSVISDASFTGGSTLSYQWQIDGQDVNDGSIIDTIPNTTVEEFYTSDTTIDIPSYATNVQLTVAGGSGASGGSDIGTPGGLPGGGKYGTFTYPSGARTLDLRVGRIGSGGRSGGSGNGGAGGSSTVATGGNGGSHGSQGSSGGGGGGGGATGIYDRTLSRYTIVAAGGGGGGGGNRGVVGPNASSPSDFVSTSGSFTITNGGGGANRGNGDGGGGGGGGGGATGGGGGGAGTDLISGAGPGNPGGSKYDTNAATLTEQGENNGNGWIKVTYNIPAEYGTASQVITTVSGSETPTLTLRSNETTFKNINCVIRYPSATNSPLVTNIVPYTSLSDEDIYQINIESIFNSGSTSIAEIDLLNGEVSLQAAGTASDPLIYYSIYAPNRDLQVEIDLYGGKGTDNGSSIGGQGGFSRIRFTLEKDQEYILTGFSSVINTPFLYKKAALIASVGAGGNAGASFNGGSGGGINVSGQNGFGQNGGIGGAAVTAGNLPTDGIFGSLYSSVTTYTGDTIATSPNGGRVLPFPKGVYWRNQGYSPSEDIVGLTEFRLRNGNLTSTAAINRGFKAGYSIVETNGLGTGNGGNGGAGATGGNGGTNSCGGGGGSGYTDGSVTVVSTTQGGSTGNANVVIRLVT
jgi:hypothetical protein